MKLKNIFAVVFLLVFFSLLVSAQTGQIMISQADAISALNDALDQKKIAVEIIDTVDSAGNTGKFTRILADSPETAIRLVRNSGQRPNIYFDKAAGRFVGPGQATGSKILRSDFIDNGGRAVTDYWKLQDNAANMGQRRTALRTRIREINQKVIPDLQTELANTSRINPKRISINNQIAKAEKEATKATTEAAEITQKIRQGRKAATSILEGTAGQQLSRAQRAWNWLKAVKAGRGAGGAGAAATVGGKGVKAALGKIVRSPLFIVGLSYDAIAISMPYWGAFTPTKGPEVGVSPDFGLGSGQAMVRTDDGKTHVFFNSVISPNSALNIMKIETFRENFDNAVNEDPLAKYVQWIGLGGADVYNYIANLDLKSGEDHFILGCHLELYSFNRSTGQRGGLVAEDDMDNCRSGSRPNQEWVIEKELGSGSYQLILRAIFEPSIITVSKDEIRSREILFEDILSKKQAQKYSEEELREEFTKAKMTEEQISTMLERARDVQDDPFISDILNFGMPAKTSPMDFDSATIEDAESENFKVKELSIHSKTTLEEKNQFNPNEINDIQVWFNFSYGVQGYLIQAFQKNNPENYLPLVSSDNWGWTGPFPNGDPQYIKPIVGFAYVFDNETDPDSFSSFAGLLSEGGEFTVSLNTGFLDEAGTAKPRDQSAATADLTIGEGGTEPEPDEVITTGYVIFKVSNKKEIEDAGVLLSDYVSGLSVKRNGDLTASFGNSDEAKRIYLQEDYLIINNVSKSNKKELRHEIEWAKTGYKTGKGGFTIEINDAEVKEGVWQEGGPID